MKSLARLSFKRAFLPVMLALAFPCLAQEKAVEEESVTSEGTVTQLDTDRILIISEESTEPLGYTYSKGTKYVDELGIPTSVTAIKPGVPVIIHYAGVGDKMVANKIVVKRTSAVPNAISDVKTTITTTTGTISELGAERIVVRTESSPEPLSYTFTKTTTYVDESGAPVSIETVKSGLPVTVHYTKAGDSLVANKVVVRKTTTGPAASKSTTTTTTTTGTISEFAPERFIVRTTSSPTPIRYRYTKTTTYVDESGAPVSIKTVKSGLPVTVHYTKVGNDLVANRVVVKKTLTTQPADGTESRTETTTTTTAGTIQDFSKERIVVRTEASSSPVSYIFSKTTTYVDETGAPVSVETVKSGLPVTVHYATEGDTRVATKVVVRKSLRK